MPALQTADIGLVRALNARSVLDLIRAAGRVSRAELARRSGLSRSTVSSIVQALIAANLVHEVGVGDSHGGRRPILLEFNVPSGYVIGVELAATVLTVVLADVAAGVHGRVAQSLEGVGALGEVVPQIVGVIAQLIADAGISGEHISGVGLGVSRWYAQRATPTLPPTVLQEALTQALNVCVVIEQDALLGALAEQRWGALQGWSNALYVYLGACEVGVGCLLNGQLYRGEHGFAGGIGHVVVDRFGPLCSCGLFGCLDSLVSVSALLAQAQAAGLDCGSIDALVAAACAGDDVACTVFRAAGRHLGVAIAVLLQVVDPGCVVIGGYLAVVGHLLLEPIRAIIGECRRALSLEPVEVVRGRLGVDAVVLGATVLVLGQCSSAMVDDAMISVSGAVSSGMALSSLD